MPLACGARFGPYEIVRRIGAGGMGEVWQARDTRLDREVALKVLPAAALGDEAARARLLREARLASRLNHPHVCTVHEVGEAEGQAFLGMELVPGQTLGARLGAGPLALEQVLAFGRQVADALAHAHERSVVHRDLKAANVVITPDGRAKVLDFGLAEPLAAEGPNEATTASRGALGAPGALAGTLAYMAPEQLRGGSADARSDVWALGVLLHEMATGRRPFVGSTPYALASAILDEPLAALPAALPEGLRGIIERCLAKDPAQRYARAGEVRAALDAVRTEEPPEGHRPPAVVRRRRLLPVAAVVVLLAIAVVVVWRAARPAPRDGRPAIESVAVLPFVNATGDAGLEYLSDGITESLIDALSELPRLSVLSRSAAFRFKGRGLDAQSVGQALRVQAVLTGTLARRGEDLSIHVELVEVRTNRHLWGAQYERRPTDLAAVQEQISVEICDRLSVRLTGEERRRLARGYTQNAEAYQRYLRGRYFWNKKTADGFFRGIELFESTIEADPDYAPAYAGLAALYNNLANYNFALVPPRQAWSKAESAAKRALEIDDSLAAAHASLALVAYQWEWDWPKADREFRRALELAPNSASTYEPGPASTHHWYAHYLMTVGRTEESLREGRRALELDPVDLASNAHQGWHQLFTRHYAEAVPPLQRTIEMEPGWPVGRWYLGLTYEQQGSFDRAIEQFEACVRLTGERPAMLALLGHARAAAGQRAAAEAILRRLEALSKERYVPAYPVAVIHAALGRNDEAFAWLERAYVDRDSWMDYLGLDPRLDGLRPDRRFTDLLRRVGLADPGRGGVSRAASFPADPAGRAAP